MDEPPLPAREKPAPDIADAESLFRDAPAPTPKPEVPKPDAGGGASGELYEVAERAESEIGPAPSPASTFVPAEPKVRKPAGHTAAETGRGLEPSEAVDQVWSRSAEWGGTLVVLALAALGVLVLIYIALSVEQYGLAFLLLLLGGGLLAVLSYPILITVERPVRVTPEQAARDYFSALSHHAPHYRRMWLLLSNKGRVSGSYASFEGFRSYWKNRLAELRQGRISEWTPLKFQVEDFRSEKSGGKSEIEADFTVRVLIRGRQQEGPIESFRLGISLVKGPDRMWYLDKGTLP
jgi:hypothetical protein